MSAALQIPASTRGLKKKFPEAWRIFEKMIDREIKNARLPLPPALRKELTAEAKYLMNGIEVEIPPTKRRPFSIRALLRWEEDVYCGSDWVDIFPRKEATEAEKALVKMVRGAYLEHGYVEGTEDLHDEVLESKPAKELNKRIQALCDRCDLLEKEYDFELDDLLYK